MSREPRYSQQQLAYFQVPPVRGQLEPYQESSRPGWRYLQCTDTPNELKVLLPPRTSTLYARMLQLEKAELAKGQDASWERILELRHLKDRMMRKCQRISRFAVPPSPGSTVQFRIVNAPPDFRLKEMERWLRTNDASNRTTRDALKRRSSLDSAGAGAVTPSPRSSRAVPSTTTRTQPVTRISVPRTAASSSKKRESTSTQSTQSRPPTLPEKPTQFRHSFLSPVTEEGTVGQPTPIDGQNMLPYPYPSASNFPPPMHMPVEPQHAPVEHQHIPVAPSHVPDVHHVPATSPALVHAAVAPQSPTYPAPDSRVPLVDLYATQAHPPVDPYLHHEHQAIPEAAVRPDVQSPEPKPHPYRPPSGYIQPRHTYDELHDAAMHPPAIGMLPPDLGMPHPVTMMPEPMHVPVSAPEEPAARPPPARVESIEDIEAGRPPMPRRRSLLRSNRNSFSGAKVVSWAMDRDWSEHMTKFDHIVYGAEVAGEELHRAREQFQGEIQGVKALRENLVLSLEKLRLETEKLQLEGQALKEHEEAMTTSFQKLKEREITYKDKVYAVLEETKRVVIAADGKRDIVLG